MKEIWEERYATSEYVYGTEPNEWFRQFIEQNKPGTVLFPADGEGRNSVFAARHGWKVTAFDLTANGREKALRLATANNVSIDFQTGDALTIEYPEDSFDVVGIFFLHLPADVRHKVITRVTKFLKPGGKLVLECFSKKHFGNHGGPKTIDLLCDPEELRTDLSHLTLEIFEEVSYIINEGERHKGPAVSIRGLAVKK